MRKSFIVLSGTRVKEFREWTPSANDALDLVRSLMKQRRPGVRIEDKHGNPVSFFDLKTIAESEDRTRITVSANHSRGKIPGDNLSPQPERRTGPGSVNTPPQK
jgi:hypothetical protein